MACARTPAGPRITSERFNSGTNLCQSFTVKVVNLNVNLNVFLEMFTLSVQVERSPEFADAGSNILED